MTEQTPKFASPRPGREQVFDLRDLIDEKVMEIIASAREGGWDREEALLAIDDCLTLRWPNETELGTK